MTLVDHNNSTPDDDVLDRYVDGLLEGAEKTAFERRLEQDASLRAELGLQRDVDVALRRMYQPTVSDEALSSRKRTPKAPVALPLPTSSRRRFMAAAALVGITAITTWQIWDFVTPEIVDDGYGLQPYRSFSTVYHDAVSNDLTPDWVCADEKEFASTFEKRFRQPLLFAPLPANIQAIGLTYCHNITSQTTCLLSRVSGEPVLVFVDRASRDQGQPQPEGALKQYRRVLDGLVLYELSKLDEPHLLHLAHIPHAP